MVAKCANPSCSARFRYLSQGKSIRLDVDYGKYEYFWLCADCASNMSLKVEWGKGVVGVPNTDWPRGLYGIGAADYRHVGGEGTRAVSVCLKRCKGEPRVTVHCPLMRVSRKLRSRKGWSSLRRESHGSQVEI